MMAALAASCGFFVLTGQSPAPPAVYTTAQAELGRTAYESSCVKCHTEKLTGRKGEVGELPTLASLPAEMQKMVQDYGGKIPPLAGANFMSKWATTKDLSSRIKEGVGGFPPQDSNAETYLNLTAYILSVNGARPGTQALTASTAIEIRSLNK